MNFGEMVARGVGVAGWIIGLIAGLGGFLVVVGVLGLALSYVMGGSDDAEESEEGACDGDTVRTDE